MAIALNLALVSKALFSMTFEYKEKMVASIAKTIEATMAPASPAPFVTLALRNSTKKSFMLANK